MENKKPKKKKSHVPFRLNMLFFIVFALFSIVIIRLGIIQIVNGDEYQEELKKKTNMTALVDAPRGLMYDRYGRIVVDNELQLSITYTNYSIHVPEKEKLEVARKLAKLIDVDTKNVTERDMKDYWILTRPEKALKKVTQEERKNLDDKEQYLLTLERITDNDLKEITADEMEVLAIKREMDRGYLLAPQRIKQGVTLEEAHIVGENLADLPGVDILRDATRHYPFGEAFRSFFGNVGQIPREKLDFYLARGYEHSDIVGTSYLELQYEEALRGQKAVIESITNRSYIVEESEERLGRRGNDLILTIDIELQKRVKEIIKREVDASRGSFIGKPTAYAVMLNPQTGEIYAMAGYDDDTGVVNNSFVMGSAVKGATILAGLQSGVIRPGEVFYDAPITLPGTPPFKSVRNWGAVNDIRALEVSSNVYMAYIAMRMAGYDYGSRCCWSKLEEAYGKIRYYFSQFGLGIETGIDLPKEAVGYNGGIQQPGNLLHLAIGQFDTYTPMQLAQYVSTIANGGYRMKPQLVKEIREPSANKEELGRVVWQYQPTVLNRVEMPKEYIDRVRTGFRQVVVGPNGTGRNFSDLPFELAAKTGTAEVHVPIRTSQGIYTQKGNNQTLAGWAPYNDPEVAFAVVVPNVRINGDTMLSRKITRGILEAYFELKQTQPAQKDGIEDGE